MVTSNCFQDKHEKEKIYSRQVQKRYIEWKSFNGDVCIGYNKKIWKEIQIMK